MQNKITIITGKRGVGKTTSLNSILLRLISENVDFKGFRTYFKNEGRLILEWINIEKPAVEMGRKTSRYSLFPELKALDLIGRVLKKEAFSDKIFCADEIGFLESLSKEMQCGILEAINTSKTALITLRKGDYPFLKRIKEMNDVRIYDLDDITYKEREKIEKEIFRNLRG